MQLVRLREDPEYTDRPPPERIDEFSAMMQSISVGEDD
jgi:hypothetical protein